MIDSEYSPGNNKSLKISTGAIMKSANAKICS